MSNYQQVTLTQFTTRVRERLGPSGQSPFWVDAEITLFINYALRTWNVLTGFWKTRVTFSTQQNFAYYALPCPLVFGAHVEIDGYPISSSSLFSWDQDDPNWMSKRGTPREWSPVGLSCIAVRPIDSTGSHTILVDGVSTTPTLVNPTDFINIGQEDFKTLLDYIQHTLSFKEGGQEFVNTQPFYKAFMAAAGVRNEKLRASNLYRRTMGLDHDPQLKGWRRRTQDRQEVGAR